MENLSHFEIIAGSCSIIAVALVLLQSIRKGLYKYRKKKQQIELDFKNEIAKLKSAGNNVSARTDLGFLVLMELSSMRDSVSMYRHHRSSAFILFVSALILNFNATSFPGIFLQWISLGCLLFALVCHSNAWRMENLVKAYENKVKEIWIRPVEGRSIKFQSKA